jgi:hypothetical protein
MIGVKRVIQSDVNRMTADKPHVGIIQAITSLRRSREDLLRSFQKLISPLNALHDASHFSLEVRIANNRSNLTGVHEGGSPPGI